MTEPTNDVVTVPASEEVVVVTPKTPFWKNRRVLKTAGIVAATAAATAVVIRKFSKNDEEGATGASESDDITEIVID